MSANAVLHLLVCVTFALGSVLLLRVPLRALFGARVAYGTWAIVPCVVVAVLMPSPASLSPEIIPQAAREFVPAAAADWIARLGQSGPNVRAASFVGWFAVAVAFLCTQLLRQWAFVRRLALVRDAALGAWVTREVGMSPAVVGVFSPKLVLPADFRDRYTLEEQELVLAHELVHLRHRDPAINLFAAILHSLLWFHPLAYLAMRCLRADQEMACDAAVMACHSKSRRSYADALWKSRLHDMAPAEGCSWKSGSASLLKRRFVMLKQPLPGRARVIAGAGVTAVAAVTCAGVAWAAQPDTAAEAPPLKMDLGGLEGFIHSGKPPLILVDGRKATEAELKDIPLSAIERIEVLPSNGDTLKTYGTEARNGVVNIVKKR